MRTKSLRRITRLGRRRPRQCTRTNATCTFRDGRCDTCGIGLLERTKDRETLERHPTII